MTTKINYLTQVSNAASGFFYPETYGAQGSGRDDTAAIQAAINAAQTAGGGTVWLSKKYTISSTLTITAHNTNIWGLGSNVSALIFTGPAGADVLQVTGTANAFIFYNSFMNFVITRTTAPTGTAAGINSQFTMFQILWRVYVAECAIGFRQNQCSNIYHKDCIFSNSLQKAGTSYGYYYQDPNNSARSEDNIAIKTGSGYTMYGMYFPSGAVDFLSRGFETAGCDYGIANGGGNCSDAAFVDCIHDAVKTSAFLLQGSSASTNCVRLIGGFCSVSGTSPAVDIENCIGVVVSKMQIRTSGAQVGVNVNNNCKNIDIEGCNIQLANSGAIGILMSATGNGTKSCAVRGNVILGTYSQGIILNGSIYVIVQDNVLVGTGTTGISLGSTTTHCGGLNSVDPANISTPVSNLGGVTNTVTVL